MIYRPNNQIIGEWCRWHNNNGLPANTKHLYNICTTSAQRLRRWSSVVQMLCKCFVFAGLRLAGGDFPPPHQQARRPNVFDVGRTLYKFYTNVLCLLALDFPAVWICCLDSGDIQFWRQWRGIGLSRSCCHRCPAGLPRLLRMGFISGKNVVFPVLGSDGVYRWMDAWLLVLLLWNVLCWQAETMLPKLNQRTRMYERASTIKYTWGVRQIVQFGLLINMSNMPCVETIPSPGIEPYQRPWHRDASALPIKPKSQFVGQSGYHSSPQ